MRNSTPDASGCPTPSLRQLTTGIRMIDRFGMMETAWYSRQLRRIGDGGSPRPRESGLGAFALALLENGWLTYKTWRLRA